MLKIKKKYSDERKPLYCFILILEVLRSLYCKGSFKVKRNEITGI